jgi:hypothetical protein
MKLELFGTDFGKKKYLNIKIHKNPFGGGEVVPWQT